MRIVLDRWQGSVTIGGTKISNLRYADDTLSIASSQKKLMHIIDRLKNISQEFCLEINKNKTKIMIVDRNDQRMATPDFHHIDGYEVVDSFIYLGVMITNTGGCKNEIRRRIQID